MNTLEILEGARDLIREEKNWWPCDDVPPYGAQHCVLTSCFAVGGGPIYKEDSELYQVLNDAMGDQRRGKGSAAIMDFNDHHTHAEVLELFNIAIANELAKQKPALPLREQSSRQPEQPKVRMATYNGHLPEPAAASEARVTPEAALA